MSEGLLSALMIQAVLCAGKMVELLRGEKEHFWLLSLTFNWVLTDTQQVREPNHRKRIDFNISQETSGWTLLVRTCRWCNWSEMEKHKCLKIFLSGNLVLSDIIAPESNSFSFWTFLSTGIYILILSGGKKDFFLLSQLVIWEQIGPCQRHHSVYPNTEDCQRIQRFML